MSKMVVIDETPDITSNYTVGLTIKDKHIDVYIDECISGHLIRTCGSFRIDVKKFDDVTSFLIDLKTSIQKLINRSSILKKEINETFENEQQKTIEEEQILDIIKSIK